MNTVATAPHSYAQVVKRMEQQVRVHSILVVTRFSDVRWQVAAQRPFREMAISKIRAIVSGLWPQVRKLLWSGSPAQMASGARGSVRLVCDRAVFAEF